MDKNYKNLFLSLLKGRMPVELPDFILHKIPKDHEKRDLFSGSMLYRKQLPSKRCFWINWEPGEGVERYFFAHLGWSFSPEQLPVNPAAGDMRIYSIKAPSADFKSGLINVQQIEGRQAVAGFQIATPWDQLYTLSPSVPASEQKRVMNKAYAESLALTETERGAAVKVALDEAFACIHAVLPGFLTALEQLAEPYDT
jgi:hypothetical protein